VTVLHRGVHEPPGLAIVPHIHADPHFPEPLSEALGNREFDAVYCLYGRLEVLATFFARRCERLIAVGGRAVYAGYVDPLSAHPMGMRLSASEDSPLADPNDIHGERVRKFVTKSLEAESAVMSMHRDGAYRATLFRYSYIYGPRGIASVEWSIIKRLLDGRSSINLPSGGLVSYSRCAARNAAQYLLLALDNEAAQGEIFNCADEVQYSQGQWVELIADCMGGRMEVVDVPAALRWTVAHFLLYAGTAADIALQDICKAKTLLGYTR
jgi:nucleoside-diphosphate-sugar epimerase